MCKGYTTQIIKDPTCEIWNYFKNISFCFYFEEKLKKKCHIFSKLFLIFRDNMHVSEIYHHFILATCDIAYIDVVMSIYSIYVCQYIICKKCKI